MESNVVAGVAYSRDEAKLTLLSVADRPGIAAAIFTALSEANVNVDMIVQNISEEGRTDMTFSCPTDQVARAEKALAEAKSKEVLNFSEVVADTGVCKVSVVGIGMRQHHQIAGVQNPCRPKENGLASRRRGTSSLRVVNDHRVTRERVYPRRRCRLELDLAERIAGIETR